MIRLQFFIILFAWSSFLNANTLADDLAKDCFVLVGKTLSPIPAETFKETQLYVVYYSHRYCGLCVPVTEKLNVWFETHKNRKDLSLIFATRYAKNQDELIEYLSKSHIKFPALDLRYYQKYLDHLIHKKNISSEAVHPFYADNDDGVPRFRFFNADGSEIDPRPYGVGNIFQIDPDELDAIIESMIRSIAQSRVKAKPMR